MCHSSWCYLFLPHNSMSASSVKWQETSYWCLHPSFLIHHPYPQPLSFSDLSQNLVYTSTVLTNTMWIVYCSVKRNHGNYEFMLFCQTTPENQDLQSRVKNEPNNSRPCATFKNPKCSSHKVELIHSIFYEWLFSIFLQSCINHFLNQSPWRNMLFHFILLLYLKSNYLDSLFGLTLGKAGGVKTSTHKFSHYRIEQSTYKSKLTT